MASCAADEPTAPVDLALLEGAWEGTLEYLDYQDNTTRIEVPASLTVTATASRGGPGATEATFDFRTRELSGVAGDEQLLLRYFPTEGLVEFGGNWAVTIAEADPEAALIRLVFTGTGEDDGRPGLIRQTIERRGSTLNLLKEVRYEDTTDFIVRSQYLLVLSE